MKPADFPILMAAMEKTVARSEALVAARIAKDPRLAGRKVNHTVRKDRTIAAIEQLALGLEFGEIINPRYIEAKDDINRALEAAYDIVFKTPYLDMRDFWSKEQEDALSEIYWMGAPSAHKLPGFLKKIEKIKSKTSNIPLLNTTVDFVREVQPLADAIATLKDKVVKRQTRSEEEKRAAKYTPPSSSSKAVAEVNAMLEKFVAESYQNLLDALVARRRNSVDAFLKAAAEVDSGEREFKPRFSRDVYSPSEWAKMRDGSVGPQASLVYKYVVKGNRPNGKEGYIEAPTADAMILADATRDADDIKEMYIVKNLKKLTSIIEGKGDDNFDDVEEVGLPTNMAYLEGSMRVKFKDGSSFIAHNSVVFVINGYGTRFNRFPLIFQNVKLPGGVPMKAPSEKRMNTVFLGKAG